MMRTGKDVAKGKGRAEEGGERLPAELSRVNLNAAGIDVGASSHFVAVPEDRWEQPVHEFEAFTADLYRLADWLAECGVETVVMESTGVYWIPLFGVLEERGFEVMLVDPRRIKNVPGRKTDVLDCQWLQQLHTYGLLSGAFRPDEDIRRLRSNLRQRAMLVEYASQHVQHMQKALTQMNLKLQQVIRDITGKTGMDIIEAIVRGERSPRRLAQLRDPKIKSDEKTIAKSLRGALAAGAHLRVYPGFGAVPDLSGQDCPVRPGRLKPSWSGLKTAATASPQLPMARSAIRKTRPASTSRASCTG